MNHHPIIHRLLEKDIEVVLTLNGYKVSGFYKSGTVELVPAAVWEGFVSIDRYGKREDINTFDDLVYLNYSWWLRTKDRMGSDPYPPNSEWVEDMKRLGLIEERTITTYEPT